MVIGITGGVGSGKSTVLDYLERTYGALIIQADQVARELMEPGGSCYEAVVGAFGEEILSPDGTINRGKLANLVFADKEKRLLLNSLTHPRVEEETRRRIEAADGLVVLEAALPREAGFSRLCERVWYIHVPEETRIARLAAQRGYSREKTLLVMRSQLSEEEFRREADAVIENGGTPEETQAQIRELLDEEFPLQFSKSLI